MIPRASIAMAAGWCLLALIIACLVLKDASLVAGFERNQTHIILAKYAINDKDAVQDRHLEDIRLLSSRQSSMHAFVDIGLLQLAWGENNKAIRNLRAAVLRDPGNRIAWAALSRASLGMGDIQSCMDAAASALATTYGHTSEKYFEAFGNYMWQIDGQRACNIFKQAFDRGIINAGIIIRRALCMDDQENDPQRAAALLDRFKITGSYSPMVHGDAAFAQERFEDAIALYQKSLLAMPQNPHILNRIALSYMKMGEKDKARNAWEECLRISPGFQPARNGLQSLSPKDP
jgi:tetratricopeptide (TPR) repeat protein